MTSLIKKISLAVSVILVIIMAVFFVKQDQKVKERAEKTEQLNRKVGDYESQINDIETDLNTRKAALKEVQDANGSICVAAKVRTIDELMQVAAWIEQYNYSLAVVLDIDLDGAQMESILNEIALHKNWCVMLTGNTGDWVERANIVRQNIAAREISETGVAYFGVPATEEQKVALQNGGWIAYSESIENAQEIRTVISDEEVSQISHVVLTEQNSLGTVAKSAMSKSKPFILSIEMENFNISFNAESVTRILGVFQQDYISPGNLKSISLFDYIEEFKVNRDTRLQAKQEYEAYEKQRQEEIKSMREEIKKLYQDVNTDSN